MVKDLEAKRSVQHSVRSGAAKLIDRARRLGPTDEMHHAGMLARAMIVQRPPARSAERMRAEAWQDIIDGCSPMIYQIAETYFLKWSTHLSASASFDDVFNAGLEGLTVAVGKFDVLRNVRLTTYATPWIRNYVQRACYAQCGAARIPEHLLQQGVDPASKLVASATMSLEHRDKDDGEEFGASIPASDAVDDGVVGEDGIGEIVAILRAVDERMPEIASLLQDGYSDRDIAGMIGMRASVVQELRRHAQIVLDAHGYS